MKYLSQKDIDRLTKLFIAVTDFNERELDAKMTLKFHQDRVELIIYRGPANGGLLYDARFTNVCRENFETDLCKIEDAVDDMRRKFLGKKEN